MTQKPRLTGTSMSPTPTSKITPRRAGAKIWGKEPGRQSPPNDTAPGRLRIPACIAAVVHKVDLLIGQGGENRKALKCREPLAPGDLLIVVNQYLRDDAGDVGRQTHHVRLHIRIVGRHHSAARHIKIA